MSTTSHRAPDPRPARTRAAIFAAARELSASDGEVTVHALAQRAGVSRAAFYTHFSGLDELAGAMFQRLFDAVHVQSREANEQGQSTPEMIRFGFGAMVAYVEQHHAFLRGAQDWKFSHRTYMTLVDTLTDLHAQALSAIGEAMPAHLDRPAAARWITGGELALIDHWLRETEQAARDGQALDATPLLRSMLETAPPWYTGLDPEDPLDVAQLMEASRALRTDG
ncbi:TetR/AcrR family transcriptional regulator [Brachybacterium sp. YJGR34]|uniref:TetR/AcrR family transcriptional regulator n=1 Tax=Brachybacterium sp. YJGR34 TaxID=2059911 RepID=UPI001E49A2FC|nr:TetR/AcrR family transcriptional regulator [Brachybacterium sp. YJGR34]